MKSAWTGTRKPFPGRCPGQLLVVIKLVPLWSHHTPWSNRPRPILQNLFLMECPLPLSIRVWRILNSLQNTSLEFEDLILSDLIHEEIIMKDDEQKDQKLTFPTVYF